MKPASRAIALVTAAAVALASVPARAQNGSNAGIPMIRDAEIEQLLREYVSPILKVAGLSNQGIQVVIINDKTFNAFVMDAHHIFVNAGALMEATTPNQLIGVFSHETGHIVGGHLSKMRQELANAQTAAIIAMLLGIGAVAAGARSNNADMANIGGAIVSGPQAYLQNTLLAYQRGQEESADRAGVRFLTMTGQSAKGMYDTFKRFADESLFSAHSIDPYAQNHPMPTERMAALAELVKTPYWDKKDPPELQFRHDMMRAKLYGFTERPDAVLRRYPATDNSMPARYARAISAYRFGGYARRRRADRCPDRVGAEQSLFLRAQRPGAARRRTSGGGNRAVAPRRAACARSRADPDHAGAGADRQQRRQTDRGSHPAVALGAGQGARGRPTPICNWRWPMATRAIWPTPISLRRRPPSPAATTRRRASLPPGPRSVFPSDRPAGCAPTT